MSQQAHQTNSASHPSSLDLVAIASTMFAIFYGVWWGTLLATVSGQLSQIGGAEDGSALYDKWLRDSAYLAAQLVVILSIHALVVSHVKVIPPSGKQVWGEIFIVGALGFLAYHQCDVFLDATAKTFRLKADNAVIADGRALLEYWLFATWLLVGLSKLYAEATRSLPRYVAAFGDVINSQQGSNQ